MPRIVVTAGPTVGLERCRQFLAEKNPSASAHAARAIKQHLSLLETKPYIGRPVEDIPEIRELVIAFGDSGYVALYTYDVSLDSIYILAFRHQKEVGY